MKRKVHESDPHTIVDQVSSRAQELISAVTKDFSGISKAGSAAGATGAVFFPDGIQLIYVKLSVGLEAKTPLVSLELEVSGQKGIKSAKSIEMAEDLKLISHPGK
jgi:hypothetical protein